MKFFRLDRDDRREIAAFNSINVGVTPIIKAGEEFSGWLYAL